MDYLPVYEDEVGVAPDAPSVKVEGMAPVTIDPAAAAAHRPAHRPGDAGRGGRRLAHRGPGGGRRDPGAPRQHQGLRLRERRLRRLRGQAGEGGRARSSPSTAPSCSPPQQEYLLALRTRGVAGRGRGQRRRRRPGLGRRATRLALWDIPQAEIERLERDREAEPRRSPCYSPMTRRGDEEGRGRGHRLQAGDMPYEIIDLSRVWVLADAYETDLARLRLGMTATLTLQAFPDRDLHGEGHLHRPACSTRRRARPRCGSRFPNPTRRAAARDVRRGHAARRRSAQGLRIPADAVIDSGTQQGGVRRPGRGQVPAPREVRARRPGPATTVEVVSGLDGRASRWSPAPTSWSTRSRACALAGGHGRGQVAPMIKRDHPLLGREPVPGHRRRRIVALALRVWTMRNIPLDALPDLSDTQVIVYSRWDRSPDIIEDQVTYPITTALLGAPQGEGDPRLLRLRLQLRLRDLRGRHRHLLGAHARARVPVQDHAAAARRA